MAYLAYVNYQLVQVGVVSVNLVFWFLYCNDSETAITDLYSSLAQHIKILASYVGWVLGNTSHGVEQYFICFLPQCWLNSIYMYMVHYCSSCGFLLRPFAVVFPVGYVFSARWFYRFCHSILGLSAPEQGFIARKLCALSVATLVSQLKRYKVHSWPVAYEYIHSASSCVCCCMCLYSSHFLTFTCRSCRGSRHRWTVWIIMAQVIGTSDNTMYTLWKLVINRDNVTFYDFLKHDWSLGLYIVHLYVWPWLALK